MTRATLPRTLWHERERDIVRVDRSFLLGDPRSMVILGEAGMGKTTLLETFRDEPGYSICTARQLINRHNPSSLLGDDHSLVIDALDEVSAQTEGDAVDLVMRKLGELGYPRFILSCRVADWRSATAAQGIAEQYGAAPIELHLDPLSRDDAATFLATSPGGDMDKAEAALAGLESRGLAGLWKNPQTLDLISDLITGDMLPASKGELFERAIAKMWAEHRAEKEGSAFAQLSEQEVLDALGAAFAALILTGKEAMSRNIPVGDEDLPLAEIAKLPGAGPIGDALDARLFGNRGAGRFSYTHRAIGEFLGARWLARQADTPRKERRISALFHEHGLVPASLRGLHAWLAWHSTPMAVAVIRADPMGVVEYGDANQLDPAQARAMLDGLQAAFKEQPIFPYSRDYAIAGVIQRPLLQDLAELITSRETDFGLRLLILQALEGSDLLGEFVGILEQIVRDPSHYFGTRSEAGSRLVEIGGNIDWRALIDRLADEEGDPEDESDEYGPRLALELIDLVGYDRFDDALLSKVVAAQIGRAERTVGIFFQLEKNLPVDRIDAMLTFLGPLARARPTEDEARTGNYRVTDLAYALLIRRLEGDEVTPRQFWDWIQPFHADVGYDRDDRKEMAKYLQCDTKLRRGVQKLVLLETPGDQGIWHRYWRMQRRSSGLGMESGDAVALLDALDPDNRQDERWRQVLRLAHHNSADGEETRAAAKRFAAHRPDLLQWIDKLAEPKIPEWEIKQAEKQRKRRARQAVKFREHRESFKAAIEKMRSGHYGHIVGPAQAYLKLFSDMGDDAADGIGRLDEWLGEELRDAALEGFDAFLLATPPHPDATEIAKSHADSRHWNASYIIVAALAERAKRDPTFPGLPDERLKAGLYELRYTRIDDHAGIAELDQQIAAALRTRGAWAAAMREYYEPQFALRRAHVDSLHTLMQEPLDDELAIALASEWLERYPDMPESPEGYLIDKLLAAGRYDRLRALADIRHKVGGLDDVRTRRWNAVAFLTDFDNDKERLSALAAADPDMLWDIRDRLGGREAKRRSLTADQLFWIISTFRGVWPFAYHRAGMSSGNRNKWDATEFIVRLVNQLGETVSDEAIDALHGLRDAPEDSYTAKLREVAGDQRRKKVEQDYRPPALDEVASAIEDNAPRSAVQLAAVLLEELREVQNELRGSDIDWYADFYANGLPRGEEACRDSLLKMMRPLPFDIQALPEVHLADDKRCDISCLLGKLMVPIEIKGQWNREIWTAADKQLDRLYVNDSRAEVGIYLILWFGPVPGKAIPKRVDEPAPTTPKALEEALRQTSRAVAEGRAHVVILDLTRPAA